MALEDITREAVLEAIGECRRLGRLEFLAKYRFGVARSYFLVHEGERYDSKAIVGVAHGYATGQFWRPADFSGGEATVARLLERLGYIVERELNQGERVAKAWAFAALGDQRDFQGNDGYADVVDSEYAYDSAVQNHGQPAVGDLVLLRAKKFVLGVGRIQRIDVERDQPKTRLRCPQCRSTSFKRRKKTKPTYWCSACKSAFDTPVQEAVVVDRYTAHYAGTWQELEGAISMAQVDAVAVNGSKQPVIRELHLNGVVNLLEQLSVPVPPPTTTTQDAPTGSLAAGRRKALVSVRKGQKGFRKALVDKYGFVCAVTGPCPGQALQAAHLRSFAVHEKHVVEEGMLLRSDIHALFDCGMLAVDPESLVIAVDPRLLDHPGYAALNGRSLAIAEEKCPDRTALAEHFEAATANWAR
ncbi:HNH endonuclease [Kutzneria albida]|uniref:HNH nuclease domain-containing protein n=1 Tax=Kutzneria albida DSM 43870 TaxID=1449976 RepID=W5VYF2_9PSEU|nr:HNH endonuclease signature motif containing protein [Kutzneria albida]AHH93597.1 hypothetical protein KALB_220 [Kutzneria albida DSM 43870]